MRALYSQKKLILAGLALATFACNKKETLPILADSVPRGCTATKSGNLVTIVCDDGTAVTVSDGLGAGIATRSIPEGDCRCPQGNGGVEYKTFKDVYNTGVLASGDTITSVNYICNGRDGTDGSSSIVSLTLAPPGICSSGGWLFSVTNGPVSSDGVPICNGATGLQGPAGAMGPPGATPAGLMITRFIAPCGNASSAWKEQLIQLSDGSLLGSFSASASGLNTRLALIPDGSYLDTDESGCHFSVSTSGPTRAVSWNAGSSSAQPGGWSAGSVSWALP